MKIADVLEKFEMVAGRKLAITTERFFLFPSPHPCAHPRTKKMVRWCISPDVIQRAVKAAGKRAGVTSRLTPHCFRHGFCEHLLEAGESIKRVGEAMGHTDTRTSGLPPAMAEKNMRP